MKYLHQVWLLLAQQQCPYRLLISIVAASCFCQFGQLQASADPSLDLDSETQNQTYKFASPNYQLRFPRDHGAHPDYGYEWWYVTGHLFADSGLKTHGLQVTVFRISPKGGHRSPAVKTPPNASYLAVHMAITDLQKNKHYHLAYPIREREGVTILSKSRLHIETPGLSIHSVAHDGDASNTNSNRDNPNTGSLRISINAKLDGQPLVATITAESSKALVLHGEQGFDRKTGCASCASHYVSWTRLNGELVAIGLINGRKKASLWFDHEFGTNTLAPDIAGWDWFALQLENGTELMAYQLRKRDGEIANRSGSKIDVAGRSVSLNESSIEMIPQRFWTHPELNVTIPVEWRLTVDGVRYQVRANVDDQYMTTTIGGFPDYWEGTCDVFDQTDQLVGHAYMELTGYSSEALRF